MGLDRDVVRAHIDRWDRRLKIGNRPTRGDWPSRLFRHEPLENAVKILRSGALLSRREAAGQIVRDIAPAEIIARTAVAHGSVRLYFRPKSPTQYRVEGIRKPGELYLGRHAPVLIILVFQAEDILTQDGIEFSDGNMQSPDTNIFRTNEDFEALPFGEIYHEGSFNPQSAHGADIVRRRCAEVLVQSPLDLDRNLQGILCRSPAERSTLLHLLGDVAERWGDRIRVYTKPGLFYGEYAYIDSVDVGPTGITFTLHPRRDGQQVSTAMWVHDSNGQLRAQFGPTPLDPGKSWRWKVALEPGTYLINFEVEGSLAYNASSIIEDLPF